MKNKQSGNVLFLILIAIALLGGLTVLMSRTGSQSDDTGDTEQRSIQISSLFKEAAGVGAAVQTLLSKGCSENQISFWYDENDDGSENSGDAYYNASSPTDRSCHVFHPSGAGLALPKTTNFGYHGQSALEGIGKTCANVTCSDLYVLYHFYDETGKRICEQINTALGHTTLIPLVTADIAYGGIPFQGTFSGSYNAGPQFSGKKSACYRWSGDADTYIFYYVLLSR